eukprot:2578574-Prymnesium_polylepis.1
MHDGPSIPASGLASGRLLTAMPGSSRGAGRSGLLARHRRRTRPPRAVQLQAAAGCASHVAASCTAALGAAR